MSSMDNFPEISFIDNETLKNVTQEMIDDYEDKYKEITEESVELQPADEERLVLYAAAVQIYQTMMYVDRAGKMNFTKYAYDDFLENLGAWKSVERSSGKAASVILQFCLSSVQSSVVTIPEGTRATAGDGIYFYTDEAVEIQVGETTVSVSSTCAKIGESYNGYEVGKINVLVDPIPYVSDVSNICESSGGADEENDENLADRIYLAPSGYSVAGPDDGYVFWAKTCNAKISDVKVYSSSDATVNIVFLSDGDIPDDSMVEELQKFLSNKKIRPLTDKVVVSAPKPHDYELNVSYFINESDTTIADTIQSQVNDAIDSYVVWQKEKIGRDINPSMLSKMICDAGAKRCVINSPRFVDLDNVSIARLTTKTVTYGGIESD